MRLDQFGEIGTLSASMVSRGASDLSPRYLRPCCKAAVLPSSASRTVAPLSIATSAVLSVQPLTITMGSTSSLWLARASKLRPMDTASLRAGINTGTFIDTYYKILNNDCKYCGWDERT